MVVLQDELENHCRSRETCAIGTPDAVVCKAARSASAVPAAVGRSVGIARGRLDLENPPAREQKRQLNRPPC